MFGIDPRSRVRRLATTVVLAIVAASLSATANAAPTAAPSPYLGPVVQGHAWKASGGLPAMRPATAPAGTTGTAPKLLAASSTATSSVGAGSFATTSLSPASGWQGGLSGGAFTWSYPMRVPPAAAGPEPAVSLSYDSHAVDGETGSTNNQPVAVGDGWRLNGSGFIERSYVPCSLDAGASGPVPTSGDRCWSTDNATLDLAGRTVLLVKDRLSGTWRLQDDDGSRLEHLTGAVNGARGGEYWRLTTTDGTQYDFGLNQLPGWSTGKAATNSAWTVPVYGNDPGEPCHASTFATSSCTQAWRWNLDYVVDPHGNAEALYYSPETNRYAQNGSGGTSYVRGGQLDHIDYGLSSTTVYAANAASDKVLFTYANRCASTTNCDSAHPTTWPDVPWALNCAAAPCGQVQPTFWSTRMLSTVTTQVWSGSAYSAVDTWALRHSFPTPGDGTSPALWLNAIGHTGSAGGSPVTLPEVVFSGMAMQNRVNATTGLVNLDRYRITSLRTETGAIVSVNYAGPDCTADGAGSIGARANTNARRCFPQLWVPQAVPPQPARADVFHTYLVTSVIQDPHTGGTDDAAVETYYVYTGAPGWRYDTFPGTPAAQRTWSTFAGVSALEVRVGSPSSPTTQQTTAYTFFRGMDRDRAASWGGAKSVTVTASDGSTVPDSRWLAGRTREVRTRNGVGGAVLSDVLATPWASRPMATDDRLSARMVGDGDVVTTAPLAAGGTRRTETRTDYDTYGRPVQVADLRSDAASTCTTTSYATNTAAWLLAYPSEKRTVGRDCATTPSYPADAVSDVRTVYDGGSVGSAPTTGDATTTQTVAAYTGSTPVWQTTAVTAYDGMGRVTSVTDPRAGLDRTTTTAYTPSARGPLTQQVVTNPLGWTTTTASDPAWGVPTSVTDANGHATTTTYDALGRRTAVWAPDRPQAANASTPNVAYAYTVSTTSPLAVATTTLRVNSLVTSWELFDGLGRPRQTQRSGEIGATVITDNYYDDAGRMRQRNQDYYTFQVQPSATLFVPFSTVSGQETLDYDAAGRILADAQWFNGTQAWQTGYAYPGVDRVDRTPPAGGTPTTTFTNSLGERTRLVQYLASAPGASAQQEATSYRYDARGDLTGTTDPAGNVSSWGFDVLGRQVSATTPDTGTSTTAYDDAGRAVGTTDARGATLVSSFDDLDRVTALNQGSAGGPLLADWTYDTLAKGQLTSSRSYVGSVVGTPGDAYTQAVTGYDAADRPTGRSTTLPVGSPLAGTYATTYIYALNGALLQQADPAEGGLEAEKLGYTYTPLGELGSVFGVLAGGTRMPYVSTTGFTMLGAISSYAQGGGFGSPTFYRNFSDDDRTNRLTEVLSSISTSTANTTVGDRRFTYDTAGRVTAETTTVPGVPSDNQCFAYDQVGDLTQAWTPSNGNCTTAPTASTLGGPAPYWTDWTVDRATGNRTKTVQHSITGGPDTTDTYAYPAAGQPHPHAVQTVGHSTGGTDTFATDAAGNTVTRPGQTLTYDARGLLAALTTTGNGKQQGNVYDADGNLLVQTDPTNGTTAFIGDTELHVAAGSTTVTARRTYRAAGMDVAERDSVEGVAGSTVYFLDPDPMGTATTEVHLPDYAVTRRYLDPFGNPRGTAVAWSSAHGYLDAPVSPFSGLTHVGSRDYDPATGRFLTADPASAPGSSSPYAWNVPQIGVDTLPLP